MPRVKKPRTNCLVCGTETARPGYIYCSNLCQGEYQYQEYIRKWKAGKVSGLKITGVVSRPVKRYLRKKFSDKCCVCGWCKVNPVTNVVPLVADHIDGNWKNNKENNLRLICPNCDSLSSTYGNLNKGNGRTLRAANGKSRAGMV